MIQSVHPGVSTPFSNTTLEPLASAIAAGIPLLGTVSTTVRGMRASGVVRSWDQLYGWR
jgi:hypothetical protein